MKQPASLVSHNQRILDQLALENLDGLRIKEELAVQEKIKRNRSLVLNYLKNKLPHAKNLDDSTIDKMAEDEFNRVLKRVKIKKLLSIGLYTAWLLISVFCFAFSFLFMPPIRCGLILVSLVSLVSWTICFVYNVIDSNSADSKDINYSGIYIYI